MSSEPGPRVAGMRASANVAGRRRYSVVVLFCHTKATSMSRGRRQGVEVFSGLTEVST